MAIGVVEQPLMWMDVLACRIERVDSNYGDRYIRRLEDRWVSCCGGFLLGGFCCCLIIVLWQAQFAPRVFVEYPQRSL